MKLILWPVVMARCAFGAAPGCWGRAEKRFFCPSSSGPTPASGGYKRSASPSSPHTMCLEISVPFPDKTVSVLLPVATKFSTKDSLLRLVIIKRLLKTAPAAADLPWADRGLQAGERAVNFARGGAERYTVRALSGRLRALSIPHSKLSFT